MIRARALPDALPRLHAVETAEFIKVHHSERKSTTTCVLFIYQKKQEDLCFLLLIYVNRHPLNR